MDFDRRVTEIIEAAETAIAKLAVKAATKKDYGRAASLLAVAERVANASRNDPIPSRQGATQSKASAATSISEPIPSRTKRFKDQSESGGESPGIRLVQSLNDSSTTPGSTTSTRKDHAPYPRFKREDDTLVKIGWSKSDKATYEHRSPRPILDKLVARMVEIGAAGSRFTTEHLLPLQDDEGAELPSYQCYLCLAWLVSTGLIERHGRQGYTVADCDAFTGAVEEAWAALPRR